MTMRSALASLVLATVLAPAAVAGEPPRSKPGASPSGAADVDISGWLDGGNIGVSVTNIGAFAFDVSQLRPFGLEFPAQSGRGVVYASGIWLGAMVSGAARVTVSEFSSEYGPGAAPGGIPEFPHLPELRVYKLRRTYSDTPTRDAELQSYNDSAYPRGAPLVQLLPDGSLSIPGDQMTFAVFNDLDPNLHESTLGGTNALQVEVRQTSWVYDRPAPIGQTVFMRFEILNRGPIHLEGVHLGIWVDPDVGGYQDDRVGCDIGRSLAYGYNADDSDAQYGAQPPAVGFDILKGPFSEALGQRLPMTASVRYVDGFSPGGATESYRLMQGLTTSGAPILDPFGGTTTFMLSGDPVAGTGWVDPSSADQRMLLSSGPFTMTPGQTQEVVLAIIVAQGADRLSSVALLKSYDDAIQAAFDADQLELLDTPAPPLATRLAFSGARPNPAHAGGQVTFSLPRASDAALEVLDLAGRRVATARWPALVAGPHVRAMPASSRDLPAGVYLLRLSAGGERVTRRWVVLH